VPLHLLHLLTPAGPGASSGKSRTIPEGPLPLSLFSGAGLAARPDGGPTGAAPQRIHHDLPPRPLRHSYAGKKSCGNNPESTKFGARPSRWCRDSQSRLFMAHLLITNCLSVTFERYLKAIGREEHWIWQRGTPPSLSISTTGRYCGPGW